MNDLSPRMKRLKEAGLLGCFDNTGVNSDNYKSILMGEWIDVKDQMPEKGQQVLAYGYFSFSKYDDRTLEIRACTFEVYEVPQYKTHEEKCFQIMQSGCGCCDRSLEDVIYWMPLPKPPKES